MPFEKTDRIKHLYFESDKYSDTATMEEIATDVFVEGKRWPISGKTSLGRLSIVFTDFLTLDPGLIHFILLAANMVIKIIIIWKSKSYHREV